MGLTITIGEHEVPGRLPMWPDRFRVQNAAHAVVTSEPIDLQAFGAIAHACIGLCWRGEPLDCPSLRDCAHDLVLYGDGVFDALYRSGITDIVEIGREGDRLLNEISRSLITEEELEQAADPTEAPAATSTESM